MLQILGTAALSGASTTSFVNWETAPVHPIELSPDRQILAVCNLPDARLELLDVSADRPDALGAVFTGLDPVSVRFRTPDEAWVVNHLSDSISVIDVANRRVLATLSTLDGPGDVVFAGSPSRAYVACAPVNLLQVFDPVARLETARIPIQGNRPKSLAVSPDGRLVYAAILESGNGSTILAGRLDPTAHPRAASPVDMPGTPHGGLNPPPNSGTNYLPAINPNLPGQPPRVPLIVKKNSSGRWLDDNAGDWTEWLSGTNAPYSGRIIGWDLPDRDLAIVDTQDGSVKYASRLMNLCMAVAVNPANGEAAVVGTDAVNEVRFEPRLQGIFHRVKLARIPAGANAGSVTDLNPHLDYTRPTVPQPVRDRSLGDPRGVVWSADGSQLYVSGMGSGNVVVLDASGARVGEPIQLGDFPGPTGLALDDARGRLFVLNRFAATIATVDTVTRKVTSEFPLFDPTPPEIKTGRRQFYDTRKTSGLGQAACASCHVDGRFDRLAWDLGAPDGPLKLLDPQTNFHLESSTNHFHPMKGPMVTQTLQDVIGHEPFHWRGDRAGIEEFNDTFEALQGDDTLLTEEEMQEFKDFLATIAFPPNPFRTFDNALRTALPLPGHRATGWGDLAAGRPLPPGNAQHGLALFRDANGPDCIACHTLPTGLSPHMKFEGNRWRNVPSGTNGAARVALIPLERAGGLPFKASSLRSVPDRLGFDLNGTNGLSGFGLLHDGSQDSLSRFLRDGFDVRADQDIADLIAFLLSLTGSDLPAGSTNLLGRPPGLPSRDVPAAVGQQATLLSADIPRLVSDMVNLALVSTTRVEVVVHGSRGGEARAWLLDRTTRRFQPGNSIDPAVTLVELATLASASAPLTLTAVPIGSGRRLSIDRDEDGVLDEGRLAGSGHDTPEPVNGPPGPGRASTVAVDRARVADGALIVEWRAAAGERFRIEFTPTLFPPSWSTLAIVAVEGAAANWQHRSAKASTQGFYRIGRIP